MFKKIINKWQAYKDKKFLARLNRVLANNILESDVVTIRDVISMDDDGILRIKERIKNGKFAPLKKVDMGCYMYLEE